MAPGTTISYNSRRTIQKGPEMTAVATDNVMERRWPEAQRASSTAAPARATALDTSARFVAISAAAISAAACSATALRSHSTSAATASSRTISHDEASCCHR